MRQTLTLDKIFLRYRTVVAFFTSTSKQGLRW